jgi:hypothetical protein
MVRRRYTRRSVTHRVPEPFDKLRVNGLSYYKFNSTPRNKYAGYQPKSCRKGDQLPIKRIISATIASLRGMRSMRMYSSWSEW